MKYRVRLEPIGIEKEVDSGTSVRDVVAEYGVPFPCAGNGSCGNCRIKLLEGDLRTDDRQRTLLKEKGWGEEWRLACLSRITEDVTLYVESGTTIIQTEHLPFGSFMPQPGYGIAVDLGSTTIVAQLVNLLTGKMETSHACINPQTRFGADIISRITYAMQSDANRTELCCLIRDNIHQLLLTLLSQCPQVVDTVSIVGNTVMHHLFSDIDVASLAAYPFQSARYQGTSFTAAGLGWSGLPASCAVRFLPNISHFVGSDVLAGIYAVGMHHKERYQVLLDLGTNGEIAIGNRERILCTSTAAGPAFEGINISCGMSATTGAIYKVELNGNKWDCTVIGGGEAEGICGSGLIDAVFQLLKRGMIDYTGALVEEGACFVSLTKQVRLTAADIREFQFAKAAICTGMQLLLARLELPVSEVENIYLAGGLGNYINVSHAVAVGLLELDKEEQLVKAGNSALMGAKASLFQGIPQELDNLRSLIEHYALETDPSFQEMYCEKLFFPL